MDLDLTEEPEAVVALAAQIFTGEVTGERCREVEDGDTGVDAALWATLAEAGLLALCVPVALNGVRLTTLSAATMLDELATIGAGIAAG